MASLRFISVLCLCTIGILMIELNNNRFINVNSETYVENDIIEDHGTPEISTVNPLLTTTKHKEIYNGYIGRKDNETLNNVVRRLVNDSEKFLHKIEATKRFPTQEEYTQLKTKLFSPLGYDKHFCMANLPNIRENVDIKPIVDTTCNAPLLTINYFGRMGNQIAQYLSLLLLHLKFDANVCDNGGSTMIKYSMKCGYISVVIAAEMEAYLRLLFLQRSIQVVPIFCDKSFNKSASVFNYLYAVLNQHRLQTQKANETYRYDEAFENSYVFIRSYPCPVYLFMEHRDTMSKELQILPYIRNKAKKLLKELVPNRFKDSILISVHVRLTDYVKHVKDRFHEPLSMNYYNRAMNFYRNHTRFGKPLFLIFSDDPEWCKMHFFDRDVIVAGDGDQENFLMDFAMITLCDHHVAGYGTFSFTSAFLGKGMIVYPLPVAPPERVFGIQKDYLCSQSKELVPIPDITQAPWYDIVEYASK